MAAVISLNVERELRRAFDPTAEFDRLMERLFEALDFLAEVEGPDAVAAHRVVWEACEMLLKREERIVSWTRR